MVKNASVIFKLNLGKVFLLRRLLYLLQCNDIYYCNHEDVRLLLPSVVKRCLKEHTS